MKYSAIIFDLDGVICSTDQYHYLAWKRLATKLQIPFEEQDNNLLRGVSRMASLEILLKKSDAQYTQPQKESFAEEKNCYYREFLARLSPNDIFPGVKETLDVLRSRGVKLAIGSSRKMYLIYWSALKWKGISTP